MQPVRRPRPRLQRQSPAAKQDHGKVAVKIRHAVLGITPAILSGLVLTNASWLAPPPEGEPKLYAHWGLHRPYARAGLTNETCTAARMLEPRHAYLENTIASMEAAFA